MAKIYSSTTERINILRQFLSDEKKVCSYYPIQYLVSCQLLPDQEKCYNYVRSELENPFNDTKALILGSAGSGKSYLLNQIRALVESRMGQESVIVVAATGMAASLVGGSTIHATFKCYMRHESSDWFQDEMENCKTMQVGSQRRLKQLKEMKKNCVEFGKTAAKWRFLICDELSFLSLRNLGEMEEIIRKELGKADFSGISVLCFGDFRQLPPFSGTPLFGEPSACQLEQVGKRVYNSMSAVFFLDAPIRQQGDDQKQFRDVLMRLADGKLEQADIDLLNTRAMKNLKLEDLQSFEGVTHLYARNAQVEEYNNLQFEKMEGEKVLINYDLEGKETLKVGINSEIYLSQNIWVGAGLANGAKGRVESIVYAEGDKEPSIPAYLNLTISSYRGPYPPGTNTIPIFPTNPIFGRNSIIKTFPIKPANAFSYHKAQSQNLDKVVADLSNLWFPRYAFAFVALSRAKRLKDISLLREIEIEDLSPYPGDTFLSARLVEEKRLREIAM